MIAENGWGEERSVVRQTLADAHTAVVAHAMEYKFRREYLRLIITCGLTAQYSRLNTYEFKVINGKRRNGSHSREKKGKKGNCTQFLDRLHIPKIISTVSPITFA